MQYTNICYHTDYFMYREHCAVFDEEVTQADEISASRCWVTQGSERGKTSWTLVLWDEQEKWLKIYTKY